MVKTFPLLPSQMGVWLACSRKPASTAYNLPSAVPFDQEMDEHRLGRALRQVIDVRPMLRTRLVWNDDGQLTQFADPKMVIGIKMRRMKEEEASQYMEDGFVRPFDLLSGQPLCRFEIIKTERHCWLLSDFHHIIADGFTITHCFYASDLSDALAGNPLADEQDGQYAYAEQLSWQKDTPAYLRGKAYYENVFSGERFTVVPGSAVHGKEVPRCISSSCWVGRGQVDKWCADHEVSSNLLFMGAFNVVLSRLCRQPKVAYATMNHGRVNHALRKAYGMFVRTVPVICQVDECLGVTDLISGLRASLLSSMRHAAYPYTDFCRDHVSSPAVLFGFQGEQISEWLQVDGMRVKGVQLARSGDNAGWSCVIYCDDHHYEIRVEASSGQYTPEDLRMFASCVRTAVCSMMSDSVRLISEVDIVDAQQRDTIMSLSAGEHLSYDEKKTFFDFFLQQVRARPEKVAVSDGTCCLTYGELERKSRRLAGWMRKTGVRAGDFVGIEAVPSCRFMVMVLASMRIGATYFPIDQTWPPSIRQQILEDARPTVVLGMEALEEQEQEVAPEMFNSASPSATAYMIYTSGTTGHPKGVMVSHAALCNLIHFIVHQWRIDADSRISCHSSLAFDGSVEDLFPVLTVGGTLYIMPESVRHSPAAIHRFLEEHAITGGCYTTAMIPIFDGHHHPQLTYLCFGGDKMTHVPDTGCCVYNTYGPTEFTVDATFYECNPCQPDDVIPIGRPVSNCAAFVVDADLRLLPIGAVGELCLSGRQMAQGYWHLPQLTAERFVNCGFTNEKIYRTGDLARWNNNGQLEFWGRIDHQVKINGYAVTLEEVEHVVARLDGVHTVCAKALSLHANPCLAVYFTADAPLDTQKMMDTLRQTCPSYSIPAFLIQVDDWPLNAHGKIDRDALPDPLDHGQRPYVPPSNEWERRLASLFAQVLGVDRVGANDHFFDLGGTSLQAMLLVAEAEKAGLSIDYGWVFDHPTPRALARIMLSDNASGYRVSDYDYTAIHEMLRLSVKDCGGKEDSGHLTGEVLLTGSTGFLGIHVLKECLEKGARVCCVVRASTDEEAGIRLRETYHYYFGTAFDEHLCRVISSDLCDVGFFQRLPRSGICQVINCAADVRHFAPHETLMRINTEAVDALAGYCLKVGARLVQVSTVSVAGYDTTGQGNTLTEGDLYIRQVFGDPYSYSKFLAERIVLGRMLNEGLDARIMRVGNLWRRSDGMLPRQVANNAFHAMTQLFFRIGAVPRSMAERMVDLSPVDKVAAAVTWLSGCHDGPRVFHVVNPDVCEIRSLPRRLGIGFDEWKVIDDDLFRQLAARESLGEGLQGMLGKILQPSQMEESPVANRYDIRLTEEWLERIGIHW